jgi:hypothetical protein
VLPVKKQRPNRNFMQIIRQGGVRYVNPAEIDETNVYILGDTDRS